MLIIGVSPIVLGYNSLYFNYLIVNLVVYALTALVSAAIMCHCVIGVLKIFSEACGEVWRGEK